MSRKHKLLAVFAYVDDVIDAVQRLKSKKLAIETVYSPVRNDEIAEALELKPSPVRYFVLGGCLFGIAFGYALAVFTAAQWKFIVWGKPPIPTVPYVIVCFEFFILMGVFGGLAGLLIYSRMPRFKTPAYFDSNFTVDRFGIVIDFPVGRDDIVRDLFMKSGAEEVRDVRL